MLNIFNSVKSRSKIIVGVFCRPGSRLAVYLYKAFMSFARWYRSIFDITTICEWVICGKFQVPYSIMHGVSNYSKHTILAHSGRVSNTRMQTRHVSPRHVVKAQVSDRVECQKDASRCIWCKICKWQLGLTKSKRRVTSCKSHVLLTNVPTTFSSGLSSQSSHSGLSLTYFTPLAILDQSCIWDPQSFPWSKKMQFFNSIDLSSSIVTPCHPPSFRELW